MDATCRAFFQRQAIANLNRRKIEEEIKSQQAKNPPISGRLEEIMNSVLPNRSVEKTLESITGKKIDVTNL